MHGTMKLKRRENTVAILVGDLGIYSVLYKAYNTHNIYDTNNKIVGLKIYNYKILYDWIIETVYFSLAYTSLVRPILGYGAACWDPYRECQISALDSVGNKAAKFVHYSRGSDQESLAQRRKTARICALYKAYTGDRAWKAIRDRLQTPS